MGESKENAGHPRGRVVPSVLGDWREVSKVPVSAEVHALAGSDAMKKGEVVWFDADKGYGFVKDDESGSEYFVHYSKILGPEGEYKTLLQGDKVSFDLFTVTRPTGDKVQAKDVTVYAPANPPSRHKTAPARTRLGQAVERP